MVDLSIIVLSYNTSEVTRQCLISLYTTLLTTPNINSEVIVIDNASADDSIEMLKKFETEHIADPIKFKLITNSENVGFPRGNNQGLKIAEGRYILFFNSDAVTDDIDFATLLKYLDQHSEIGALTVRVNLRSGMIDPASHRGFPTIWNSFCYFTKLEKLFGQLPYIGRLVGGYHLTYLDLNTEHEIDSAVGAFYLTRKEIMDKIQGFDEDYFMYGEDLDMSFKIKKLGYKIVWYPHYTIIHLKHTSGLKKADSKIKSKTQQYFYDAMKTFYRKHYSPLHFSMTNKLIYFFIDLKRHFS